MFFQINYRETSVSSGIEINPGINLCQMRLGDIIAIFISEYSNKGDKNVVQPNHALVITLTSAYLCKQEHNVDDLYGS
jgi:hypothetical protein